MEKIKRWSKAIETLGDTPTYATSDIMLYVTCDNVTALDRRNNDQSLLEIIFPLDTFISQLVENVRCLVRVQKKNIGEKCTFDAACNFGVSRK